jgi:hypothetical protein
MSFIKLGCLFLCLLSFSHLMYFMLPKIGCVLLKMYFHDFYDF